MERVNVVSALIYDDNENILIVKNIKGDSFYWSLPGGAVEGEETLEQAIIREVKEETGFKVVVTGLSSVREMFFEERGHHALIITFHAKIIDGEININDPDNDIVEVRWANSERVNELMPSLYERLKINSDINKTLAFYAFEGIK
ncbi:NUDIX domain-containing protein [Bacillus sp. AFS018417]|uniref:NUDIX hydrolase n=1 Tax=Bacillus sp. AFS018417 TaxID=2033491 RepID=UPI000BF5ACB0|nr:NUDIX hydrolase [Bacillus sp. AFS018417]PEZ03944.1 NUDIX domain-containing protein [Bacillus sp. AFS018417]